MTLTHYVADFTTSACFETAPPDVVHLAKRSILDGLGLAVAGARSDAARLAQRSVHDLGARSEATVLGSPLRVPARFAALLNGLAIHADDYDDTQLAVAADRVYGLLTHPTAPVLPAVLALAEAVPAGATISGRDLLLAYLVGVEVATKIAEAISPRHYIDGFHTTGTVGALGAAAGAARVLGLDAVQTARALGIAASQASGLRENFGTMMKPFHAGRAAENGVVAAQFARLGFTAADTILEAPRGFFRAMGGGYEASAIVGRLGQPWTFASPGISIKPHPSGSLTHPGMGVMLDLIRRHDIQPDQVARVTVGTNRHLPNALIHHRPQTALQAKFSMEFCIAILLLERRAGLAEFTDAVVRRPDVQALLRRVEFGVHPEAEAAGSAVMRTMIEVELTDGRVLRGQADFGQGSPQLPMSDDELLAKFMDCTTWGKLDPARARQAAELVWQLDTLADIRALVTLLAMREGA